MPFITLLTDFGTRDEFVGVMKGGILSVCPDAVIIDISHEIAPQDVEETALMLKSAYGYFPKGTVHVSVVDPGVGGERRIVAAALEDYTFLAPDNGILTPVLDGKTPETLVSVENQSLFAENISRTFHGRDIFAPVAGHLAGGLPLDALGPALDKRELAVSELTAPIISPDGNIEAHVISVDRFGNLGTDIDSGIMQQVFGKEFDPCCDEKPTIILADKIISGLSPSYNHVPSGSPLAVFGSRGYLEISVNRGNASRFFRIEKGARIQIKKSEQ